MSGEGYPGGYAVTGGGGGGAAISAGAASQNTGTVIFSNSNGVSFGLNAGTLTASAAAGAGIAIADSAGTQGTGTVIFSNANGVSFGLNAGTMTATVQTNYLTTADLSQNSSKYIQNWKLTGNTAGTTSSAQGTDLWFNGGNSITVSGNSNTINFSVGAYITTQSAQAFSAAGGSSAFQTLSFGDTNSVSFTNTNGSVGIASVKLQMFAVSNTTQATSGTANHTALSFGGAGIASVGVTGGSVVVSVPSGGGAAFSAGVSNIGNSAGSTGTISNQIVFVGSQGITLSESTGGASSATISIIGPRLSEWYPLQGSMSVSQKGQNTFYVQPMQLPCELVFDLFAMPINFSNASNSSGSMTISWWVGIYTSNVSTLSRLHSTSVNSAITMSGTQGSYSLFGGVKRYGIPWTTTIQPGNYWVGIGSQTATGAADMSISQYAVLRSTQSNMSGAFGFASNLTRGMYNGQGYLSVTTAAVPDAIGFSDISATANQQACPVMFYFLSNTF